MKIKYLGFLAFYLALGGNGWAASVVRINEVAPVQSTSGDGVGNWDFIEIYNSSTVAVDVTGWTIRESGTDFKVMPATSMPAGAYWVIYASGSATNDETTGDLNGNGHIDFYAGGASGSSSITDGDEQILLKNATGVVIDAVIYQTGGAWTGTTSEEADWDAASSASPSQWVARPSATGGSTTDDANVAVDEGPVVKNGSIGRDNASTDTDATGTPKNDWFVYTAFTPGLANGATPPPPPVSVAAAVVKITEVAPSISGGDFIEFFVQTGGSISGWTVKEGATTLKTFPTLNPKAGKHIVLHVTGASTADETDSTGDTNGNGYIDLYSTDTGLQGTDNTITLIDADAAMVDFISYANDDPSYSFDSNYNDAVTAGQWLPSADSDPTYISGSVAWSGLSTQSMSRVADSSGNPTDNNRKDDWALGNQSPGDGFGTAPQQTASTLEVFQSPFSPYGDGRFNKALIAYNVLENSLITIRVFDLQGRQVRTLLDAVSGGGSSASTFWDGKDDFGNVLPVGIYLVNIEAQDKSTGDLKKSSKSVVLGRKLK